MMKREKWAKKCINFLPEFPEWKRKTSLPINESWNSWHHSIEKESAFPFNEWIRQSRNNFKLWLKNAKNIQRKTMLFLSKTTRETDSILNFGSRYVSGNYQEQRGSCGVSKAQNLPSFWLHFLVASTSSRNYNIAQWLSLVSKHENDTASLHAWFRGLPSWVSKCSKTPG